MNHKLNLRELSAPETLGAPEGPTWGPVGGGGVAPPLLAPHFEDEVFGPVRLFGEDRVQPVGSHVVVDERTPVYLTSYGLRIGFRLGDHGLGKLARLGSTGRVVRLGGTLRLRCRRRETVIVTL